MHGHMVQQGSGGDSRHRARKNNGKVRESRAGFCGNAAEICDPLLNELRFHGESTAYRGKYVWKAICLRISDSQIRLRLFD